MALPALLDGISNLVSGLLTYLSLNPGTDITVAEYERADGTLFRIRVDSSSLMHVEESTDSGATWTDDMTPLDLSSGDLAGTPGIIAATVLGVLYSLLVEGYAIVFTNPLNPNAGTGDDGTNTVGPAPAAEPPITPGATPPTSAPEREVVEWIDAGGHRRLTVNDAINPSGTTFIDDAVAACSNAVSLKIVGGPLIINDAPAPVDAQWVLVDDEAHLLFQAVSGSIGALTIPAPKSAIFLADGETVDPANAAIITLVAACTDALIGLRCPDGTGATSYLGGTRRGRRGPAGRW